MRFICKTVVMGGMGLLLVAPLANADDIEQKLERMEERMTEMEVRLDATNDELEGAQAKVEEQQEQLEAVGLAEERRASSGISEFLQQVDMNAWVAASYNYNFNGTSNDIMAKGGNNSTLPHHPNPNTFQLDQVWISIDKTPVKESRGGFHIDFAAGVATDSAGWSFTDSGGDTVGSSPYAVGIFSAYASYLAPIFEEGIRIDGGQLPTMLGGEVVQTNANFNITRGLVWGLQPTTNLGLVTKLNFGNLGISAGFLNEPIGNDQPTGFDANNAKALTTQVSYSGEKFAAYAGVNWGISSSATTSAANVTNNNSDGIVDLLLTADPLGNLSTWVNYDYRFGNDRIVGGGTATRGTHGLAMAARLAVLDETGLALRFEWVRDNQQASTAAPTVTTDDFSLTGTVDHELWENLTLKTEVRWDRAASPARLLDRDGNATKNDAVVLLFQMMYEF
jgi:hypothetical protein